MTNKDTSIISVRIKKETKDKLEKISDKETVNLSTMTNRILTNYTDWNYFGRDLQFTILIAPIIKELFENIKKDRLEKIMNIGAESFEHICEYVCGEYNFGSFIQTMDYWLAESNFQFRHLLIGNSDKYLITHGNGTNFSNFILHVFSSNVEKMGYVIKDSKIEDKKIAFTIQKV